MAASWIKMRTNLHDDPKVRLVAQRLKCNACTVTGALHYLWSLGDSYSADGHLPTYTPDELDRRVGLPGFANALAAKDVDWLEIGDNYLRIPRFEKHNGESAKKRAQTADRVAKLRAKGKPVTQGELPEKRREEKIREEEDARAPRGGGEARNGESVTAADRNAAVEAISTWSHRHRAHGLVPEQNEIRKVEELLDVLAQDTLARGDETVHLHRLVPLAAETLAKDGTQFKSVGYAAQCIRNRLTEWKRTGVPGTNGAHTRTPTKVELARQRIAQTRPKGSAA